MWLFSPNADKALEYDIRSAIPNLNLFLNDNKCDAKGEYLLADAMKQIASARKRLEKTND